MSAADDAADHDDLYDGAACGLLSTHRDGTIQQVNQTFCEWVGFSRSQLVGVRKLQDLLTVGGRIFHQTHWLPLLQIQGSVAEIALEMIHADQRKVPMLMNAVRRERGGVITHEVAVFISEDRHAYEQEIVRSRKQAERALAEQLRSQRALVLAEQRLRLAVEAAQLFLWEDDAERGGRVFDDRAALLLGHAEPRPISADDFNRAVEPSTHDSANRHTEAASGLYRHEYRINGVDGLQRTILETGHALLSEDEATKPVGVLQDITEISRQRVAAEERAIFAQQMIGIVSHDLRNPLSAIMLGSDMLLATTLEAKQQRYAQAILNAAHRSQRMVSDLLDFTAAKLGRGISVRPAWLDLHALVARCIDELSMSFPQRNIRHLHEGTGDCVADADRLVQLIGNLVGNALKYGAADGVVTVRSSIQPTEFSLEVHNTGDPIPPDLIAHLFEPMSRGEHAPDADRSVGLGLFIVREVARGHGGQITVTSSAEAGTMFSLVIPKT